MRLRTMIAPLAALLLGSAPADAEGPALWKLADADTTIWLFGTIHVLPSTVVWQTPAIRAAVAASDALVIETVIGPDRQAAAALMMRLGMSPGLPPLAERVNDDRRVALADMIRRSGIDPAALDRMESWAAAMMLVAGSFGELGLDDQSGVEAVLQRDFAGVGKPIEGLEPPEQQLGYLDTLPEAAQRTFLDGVIDDPAAMRAQFDEMLAAWKRGDQDAIARVFEKDVSMSSELREALLVRRNAAWSDWLVQRLDRPGTVFVAVGAGHLAGPDSVQAMLAKRGMEVHRAR